MLLNAVLEKTLLRVPWTAGRSSQSILKEVNPEYSFGRTDTEAEAPVLWPPDEKSWVIRKKPWFWERLKAGGEGDDRGWDGWMVSLTQWTWVWASSGNWWRTGKPGVLQSMGSQRVGHDWATEQEQQQHVLKIIPANSLLLKNSKDHQWNTLSLNCFSGLL